MAAGLSHHHRYAESIDFTTARCRSTRLDFFSETSRTQHNAKMICAQCPLLEPCREWGIANEFFGVWGGTTAAERIAIRRQRGGPKLHARIRLPGWSRTNKAALHTRQLVGVLYARRPNIRTVL